jgi:hypothetical protein
MEVAGMRDRMACLGAPTVQVRTTEYMERCQACGTEVQYQLVDHPFWGFRAGCNRAGRNKTDP